MLSRHNGALLQGPPFFRVKSLLAPLEMDRGFVVAAVKGEGHPLHLHHPDHHQGELLKGCLRTLKHLDVEEVAEASNLASAGAGGVWDLQHLYQREPGEK